MFLRIALICVLINLSFNKDNFTKINSGPMVGYSEKSEVALWIQTSKEARLKFSYWDINFPNKKYHTNTIVTNKESGYTATLIADEVKPGNKYNYHPIIDDEIIFFDYELEFQTQEHWEYRKDAPNFSFAVGSCAYTNEKAKDRPGKSYGQDYFIYNSILDKNPDFMIWLGDNVYLREPDWNTKTGIYHRYTHDRSIKELQPLLGSVHHYAIWDDHDYGPNNSDRSFRGKHIARNAFKDFWANPSYGINENGITTQFTWSDVDFFLLDNRFFRSPQNRKNTYKEILGKNQLEWLIDALSFSKATFKIIAIGGQVLNSEKVYENYSNWTDEHTQLLELIKSEKIEGVIFISGDRHFSEVSKMERYNSYPLHDFTVSPLTSGFCDICVNENNKYRLDGSTVFNRNFAIFNIIGPSNERILEYTIYDNKGNSLWKYTVHEDELKY
tara:strand:+ start:1034 stop:2359 length:1326 start_codon:yes stop_codon:yes gene_type:complete